MATMDPTNFPRSTWELVKRESDTVSDLDFSQLYLTLEAKQASLDKEGT